MSGIPGLTQFDIFGRGFSPFALGGPGTDISSLLEAASRFFGAAGDLAAELARLAGGNTQGTGSPQCTCAPVSPPTPEDSTHPAGSLKVDGDTVTTAGGYEIKMIGKHEWQITGPDGKTTRIWGDPHVDEGDRDGNSDWDFKRNSTFVLGDGTRINVTTVPGGADGMTVTGSLEIISGNDRVEVENIDKGKGEIGTVTQDGYQRANSFDGDVFVMGRESDDWSFTGREIVGSKNGGEEFELGGELHPRGSEPVPFGEAGQWLSSLFKDFFNQWQNSPWQVNRAGTNPYYDVNSNQGLGNDGDRSVRADRRYDRRRHMETMADAFRAFAQVFDVLARVFSLSEQLSAGRFNQQYMTA
jgi:Domain of Unknown Function (DUF1521)